MMKRVLPSEVIKKLGGIKLASKSKIRGQHKGSHRSNRIGVSMDFSDYREYHVGDDVRQIDWNVFARSEKYYIKRFLDEQEMRVHIVLDGTKSMSGEAKWLLAKQLTAALGQIVMQRDDRLTCSLITDVEVIPFRKKGSVYKQRFLQTVKDFPEPTLKGSFVDGVQRSLTKGQTVLILVTDALEPIEQLDRLITRLPRYAGDVRLLQIVEEAEVSPSFTGDVELMDIETEQLVNVSMSSGVMTKYEQVKREHEEQLSKLCARYGVAHLQVVAEEGLQHALFQRLRQANWIQ